MEWRALKFNTAASKTCRMSFIPRANVQMGVGKAAQSSPGSTGCLVVLQGSSQQAGQGLLKQQHWRTSPSSDKIILEFKQLQPIKLFMTVTVAKLSEHGSKVVMD